MLPPISSARERPVIAQAEAPALLLQHLPAARRGGLAAGQFACALAVGGVVEAIDGADDVAGAVLDRLDMQHHGRARAVRPLDHALRPMYRGAGLEDVGHRRRFAGDPPAVEVPPVRAAEALAVIADTRGAAPQLGGLAVEPEDAPAGIAGVGSDGQDLQDARRCVGQGPRIHGLADGRRSQGSNSLVHQPLPVVLGASGRLVMPLGAGFQASIQHSRMGRNSLVQGTRSSHTCAASAVATFGFQSGTRIMELLASFLLRSSHQRAPQGVANFGIGH
jgi:hypothetical protein